jgi:hypothetical protein
MRELQGVEGVLLHQEHRELFLAVQLSDRIENLPRDERRQTERGFVEKQKARLAHERAADR